MITQEIMYALLDSIIDPIMFVDAGHIIRYMNKQARAVYEKRGYGDLIGKSLFACHQETSRAKILSYFEAFQQGTGEKFVTENKEYKIYMRAVRDKDGNLFGYYQRYEKV